MKTKKPSAIVYNWNRLGKEILISTVYSEEFLKDEVIVYSIEYKGNVFEDYNKYRPDIIISFGEPISTGYYQLDRIHFHYDKPLVDDDLANRIVVNSINLNTQPLRPRFSVFTPTYKTKDRIFRTYDSLKSQVFTNWEWIVVDDSPDDETWNNLLKISEKDYRVKPHKIIPQSGGNIGLAKHRAAMLCQGDWLIELDHDDALVSTCMATSNEAILQFPDAGFLYTDCCELYDDGEMKHFDHDWSGNYYARRDNGFDFGYAGHSWVIADGKQYLKHWYPEINPLTIRFNISMPNHARMWKREVYHSIGGHNIQTPIADDFEIIQRTFLTTRFIHIKKLLYLQYNNRNSTVDNNSTDINRRARLIRDYYDRAIHNRIIDLGFHDWNWDEASGHSQRFQNKTRIRKYYEEEQVMNYIYAEKDENLFELDGSQRVEDDSTNA